MRFKSNIANNIPVVKEIYEECITNQTEIYNQIELIQYKWVPLDYVNSLVYDNVSFDISFSSKNFKKLDIKTKYYKFVSLMNIEGISEDLLHLYKKWFPLLYIAVIVISLLVAVLIIVLFSYFIRNRKRVRKSNVLEIIKNFLLSI